MKTSVARPISSGRPELKREMGLWTATAMVIGNMIGSGVFLLPAALAGVAVVYGSSALLAWVVTGVGAMLLAGVFATMGRAYPKTGGPYAYARRAFGDFVGFQTAWGYWIAAWVGNAAIATAFVGYTTVVWPGLGDSNLAMAFLAVGSIWLLTFVNILGVREGGWVQVATTILKFVPLALIGMIGLFFMNADHFTPILEATGSTGRQGADDAARDHGGHRAHALGVHRSRVGHRAGRGGEGSREDHPAGHLPRDDRHHADLHRRDGRGDGDHPALGAADLQRAVRRRCPVDLRRQLGQVGRGGRA